MGTKLGQVGKQDQAGRRAEKSARERAGDSTGDNTPEKHNGKASRWRQRPRPPSPEKLGSHQLQGHSLASALQAPEPCELDQRNRTASRWRQRPKLPNPPSPVKPGSPPASVSAPSP
ncbi:hypothetical protein ISCGN_007648 [Ixodes scapularis]